MAIIDNSALQQFCLPGLVHRTLAGRQDGLTGTEVWMQTIAPGEATPVHYHDCEEVIVILRGSGRAITAGEEEEFGPNSTLVFAPEVVHQVVNSGDEEMFLLAAFSKVSPGVFTPEGERMPLPWQAETAGAKTGMLAGVFKP